MNRITTDHPSDNIETALNLFYIKNGETWVRGGGPGPEFPEASLFDYLREIVKMHGLEIDISDETAIGLSVLVKTRRSWKIDLGKFSKTS